jgi:hypothetical protein
LANHVDLDVTGRITANKGVSPSVLKVAESLRLQVEEYIKEFVVPPCDPERLARKTDTALYLASSRPPIEEAGKFSEQEKSWISD